MPACIRIVLHHCEVYVSEADVAAACKTTPLGTDLDDAVRGVTLLGFKAIKLQGATSRDVMRFIQSHHPVIVLLGVKELPYGGQTGMHAVVVNSYEASGVSFIDPARGEEIVLALGTFLKAWQARGCRGLIIES